MNMIFVKYVKYLGKILNEIELVEGVVTIKSINKRKLFLRI